MHPYSWDDMSMAGAQKNACYFTVMGRKQRLRMKAALPVIRPADCQSANWQPTIKGLVAQLRSWGCNEAPGVVTGLASCLVSSHNAADKAGSYLQMPIFLC